MRVFWLFMSVNLVYKRFFPMTFILKKRILCFAIWFSLFPQHSNKGFNRCSKTSFFVRFQHHKKMFFHALFGLTLRSAYYFGNQFFSCINGWFLLPKYTQKNPWKTAFPFVRRKHFVRLVVSPLRMERKSFYFINRREIL